MADKPHSNPAPQGYKLPEPPHEAPHESKQQAEYSGPPMESKEESARKPEQEFQAKPVQKAAPVVMHLQRQYVFKRNQLGGKSLLPVL